MLSLIKAAFRAAFPADYAAAWFLFNNPKVHEALRRVR